MFKRKKSLDSKGQSLVEILVAFGVFALVVSVIITIILDSRAASRRGGEQSEAQALALEGLEAAHSIRDYSWAEFIAVADRNPHGLTSESGRWQFAGENNTFEEGYFTREIFIENVSRNVLGEIVKSGGVIDPKTFKITSRITWDFTPSRQVTFELTSLLANWASLDLFDTTVEDFSAGQTNNTQITEVSDGEVVLENLPVDWSDITITGTYDTPGADDARAVFSLGDYVYLGTELNTPFGDPAYPEFYIFHFVAPDTLELVSSLNIDAHIYDIKVIEPRVYLATGAERRELTVLDISDKTSPWVAGSYTTWGPTDAQTIDVVDNTAYLGTKLNNYPLVGLNPELHIIDVSNLENMTTIGGLEVGDSVNGLDVEGDYAYLATNSDTQELIITDVATNPASPAVVGTYDLPTNTNATDVIVHNGIVFITTAINNSGAELYVLDANGLINGTGGIEELSNYDAGEDVSAVALDPDNQWLFMTTPLANPTFIVLNISDLTDVREVIKFTLPDAAYGLTVNGNNVFVAVKSNDAELVWLTGDVVTLPYVMSGDYVSAPLDTGSDTTIYNHIHWQAIIPGGTNLFFQTRTAATSEGLESASWVGPDGTGETYYQGPVPQAIALDPGASGTRFIQYRAYFYADENQATSPVLESVTINYNRR